MKAYKIIAGSKDLGMGHYIPNEEYYFDKQKAYQRYNEGEKATTTIKFQYAKSKITDCLSAIKNVEKAIQDLKKDGCIILEITTKKINYFTIDEIEIN